jgi:hypothetical protein
VIGGGVDSVRPEFKRTGEACLLRARTGPHFRDLGFPRQHDAVRAGLQHRLGGRTLIIRAASLPPPTGAGRIAIAPQALAPLWAF